MSASLIRSSAAVTASIIDNGKHLGEVVKGGRGVRETTMQRLSHVGQHGLPTAELQQAQAGILHFVW